MDDRSEKAAGGGKVQSLWRHPAVRVAISLGALGLILLVFREAKISQIGHLLAEAPALLVVPLFMLAAMALDTLGWRRLMGEPGSRLTLAELLGVRIATEGVILSVPSGTVLSEPLTFHLLRSRCGLPGTIAVASMTARRCYIALSLGIVLLVAAIAGFPSLVALSPHVVGAPGLAWVAPVAALVLIVLALAMQGALIGGSVGEKVHRTLQAIPVDRLRRWLERKQESFAEVDRQLATSFSQPGTSPAGTIFLFCAVWIVEVCESYFILRLLGAGLTFHQVFAFESLLTLLRALAVPDAVTVGAAFVLVKRVKELVWIAIGYVVLARMSAQEPIAERATEPAQRGSSS
ncbi:MAG TPA: lysylphosphatidylglycerol synthase domain-containing protein [Thermoanaerobaculia bacterium]